MRARRVDADYSLSSILRGTPRVSLRFERAIVEPETGESEVALSGTARVVTKKDGRGGLLVSARGRGDYHRRLLDPNLGASARAHRERARGGTWTGRFDGRKGPRGLDGEFHIDLDTVMLDGTVKGVKP